VTLLLDTHVLVWWRTGAEHLLSRAQTTALESAERTGERVAVSGITLWEIAKLVERGRLVLRGAPDELLSEVESNPRVTVLPITARVALESTRLGPTFPRDPADQMIAATARVHGLRLVTTDGRIRETNVVSVV
jgi:PIN domain nuclease of toxin-antitoxin system